ncbi:EAL domain-containing protein [Thermodesulfitimonas sp.]
MALVLIAFLLTGGGSAVYGYRHYTEQREKYFQTLRQTEREAAANAAFLLGEVLRSYRELVFITATRLAKMNLDDDAGIDQFLTEKVIGLSLVDNFYFCRERDGKLLDSANAQFPPNFDPRQRPWYREAVAARGFIVTEPYRDAATGELCLTLAVPVYQQQELRGVLGLDIFLRTAAGLIANLKCGPGGCLWVVDGRGYILIHPNKALVGLNLFASPQAWRHAAREEQDCLEALRANWRKMRGAFEGELTYRNEKNELVLAQFWTVPVGEWKVVASVAPAEVQHQLRSIALFDMVMGGFGLLTFVLLAGLFLSVYGLMHRKELQFLATHDFLTGLPNRYFLELNLKRALARARRGRQSALLFLDFDNFKLINDTLGHSAGDTALKFMVSLLRKNLREGDLLARVGGDEFAVLLEGSGCEEAEEIAERLRRVVDETPVTLDGHTFNLSLSIGIALLDEKLLDEKMDIQRLLGQADAALYTAKESGGNTCVIVRPEEDLVAASSAASYWVSRIKAALREEGFILFFQPVVSVGDARILYHEVLLRLRAEDGTLIAPDSFIPVGERFGLMPQIDCWVTRRALKVLQANRELTLFVNLSAASIGSDMLLDCIITAIKESGVDPRQLGFEITETAVMKDFERAKDWLRVLRDLGCRFALDDFGAGCTSFSLFSLLAADYLDYLKIAGTFVRGAAQTPSARSIVQAITTVAAAFGRKTVAEGVENEAILEVVREIGVDYAQGFYFGKPQPEIKV